MALLDNCDPDRADMGGGSDVYERWGDLLMEHQYKVGEWYKTRGGFEAQVLDVNYKSQNGRKIVGKIKRYSIEELVSWYIDGSFLAYKEPHQYDLMPPVERKELWVNVYGHGVSCNLEARELADKHAADNRIGLVKITITGDEFEVEKVTG